MSNEVVRGYKAFDKNMQCRGFQYENGKTYSTDKQISLCEHGFHFCENPFDTLSFYALIGSKFSEVETEAKTKSDNTKTVCASIKIGVELGLSGFVEKCISHLIDVCCKGDASSGYSAQLASSGDYAKLASSGDYAQLESTGANSVICAIGKNSTAKGVIGTWITLSEYVEGIPFVKTEQVDGKDIKPDTWYCLKNRKFQELA